MLGRRNTRGSMLEVAPSRSPSSSNLLGCLILVMFCKVFPHPAIPVWLCGKPTNHNPQRVRNVVGGFAVSHIEFSNPYLPWSPVDPYCSYVFGMGGPTTNQIGISGCRDSKAQRLPGATPLLAAALGSAAVLRRNVSLLEAGHRSRRTSDFGSLANDGEYYWG